MSDERWVVDLSNGSRWLNIFSETMKSLALADEDEPNEQLYMYNCEGVVLQDFIITLANEQHEEIIRLQEENACLASVIHKGWVVGPKPTNGALMRGMPEGWYQDE